jgi:signal transduction histidine kinase
LRMVLSAEGENVRVEVYNSSRVNMPVIQTRLSQTPFSATSEVAVGGLDLAIASSIVQQHNGRMRVERQAGGNSVILELPGYSGD